MKIKITSFLCVLSFFIFAQQRDSIKVEIKNLGPQVNSAFSDYAPLISADATVMVFTSRRPVLEKDITKDKESTENVFTTYYDDKNSRWLVTFLLGPTINTPEIDNSAIALSNDGQRMFVYRGGNEQNAKGDILESVLDGDEWSEAVRLPAPINTDDNESSASIAPDGRTIYFISERKRGYGGRDIWYSTQDENGVWSEAINMGSNINTTFDEEGIFIHPNGKILFFSSMGHNSFGGYDIFMSVFDETTQTWAPAQNIGAPINTAGDDIYFVLGANGKIGYYASSKEGGFGGLDIYSVTFLEDLFKKNVTILSGRVLDRESQPIGSTIVLTEKQSGKYIGTFKSNKATGKYLVSLPPGKKYEFLVTADNYTPNTVAVDLPFKAGYSEMVAEIVLEKGTAINKENAIPEKAVAETIELEKSVTNNDNSSAEKAVAEPLINNDISFPKKETVEPVINKDNSLPKIEIVKAKNGSSEIKSSSSGNYIIPERENLVKLDSKEVEVLAKVFNNLEFDTDKDVIESTSFASLDELANLMLSKPSWKLKISGHADIMGNDKANLKLSKKRALALKKYLVRKGIPANRFKLEWFGSSKPIADNNTNSGRQQNRRVEMVVIE